MKNSYRDDATALHDLVRDYEVHRDVYVDDEIFALQVVQGRIRFLRANSLRGIHSRFSTPQSSRLPFLNAMTWCAGTGPW